MEDVPNQGACAETLASVGELGTILRLRQANEQASKVSICATMASVKRNNLFSGFHRRRWHNVRAIVRKRHAASVSYRSILGDLCVGGPS